jgi:hypothetical protein
MLAAAGIAAGVWLTSAQESTRMTNAQADVTNQAQPVTAAQAQGAAKASPATANANASVNAAGKRSATQQPSAPPAPSTAGQRAFIDPATGELRQPEHDEIAAIAAAAAAAPAQKLARTAGFAANTVSESFGDDGSVQAVVPEDLHTFSVATRGADGRVKIDHAQGAKQAAKVMKTNSAKKGPQAPVRGAQVKEDRNDR